MKAFYGSASYLWLILTICCMMGGSSWESLWISAVVGAYVIIGKAIIFMVKLMWEMEHDPAVFHNVMNHYLAFIIMEQSDIRTHIKYGK